MRTKPCDELRQEHRQAQFPSFQRYLKRALGDFQDGWINDADYYQRVLDGAMVAKRITEP